tara:strand:- start:11614 stop:12579 length:966 start_codon:yes stop_codon:yes gene_type:complete
MALKSGKNAYTLMGSGDHSLEGGRLVKGANNDDIHIQGGVESDIYDVISKAHSPADAEDVLAVRKGYGSFNNAPMDRTTGNRQYGDDYESRVDKIGEPEGWWQNIQAKRGWGRYNTEAMQQATLEDMFYSGYERMAQGTETMYGFIDEQLAEKMTQFGYQGDMLGAQEAMLGTAQDRLDIQSEQLGRAEAGTQRGMISQKRAIDQRAGRTNLVTNTNQNRSIEELETTGKEAMLDIGSRRKGIELSRQDLASQADILGSRRGILESQGRSAGIQAETDKYNLATTTGQQMAAMMTQYMTSTGEDIPDDFMKLYDEYMSTYG